MSTILLQNSVELERICAQAWWVTNQFLVHNQSADSVPDLSKPWVMYEDYMQAQTCDCHEGRAGVVFVKFPPEIAEHNHPHIHPLSDRIITVLSGCGTFEALRGNRMQAFAVDEGDRIFMPRGVLHTFRSGAQGMVIHSVHNPFISLTDPLCLVVPKE